MLADNIDALDNATRAQQARDDGAPTLVASGRFRVVAELGRGAYGVVYRAVDNELDRPVALKVLPRRRAAAEILREARILARLNHPNVVTIYDVGRTRELDFVAMELVEGVTLRHWMGEAHSAAERLTVVCAAGAGLAAAHGQQVVHGDFKPESTPSPPGRP